MPAKSTRKTARRVIAKKPISPLKKPISADFKALFKALGKAVLDLATTQWEKLAGDVLEASFALGLQTEPEELAYLLVHRSMARATIDLVGESINLLPAERAPDAALIESALANELENAAFVVDKRFFQNPGKSEVAGLARNLLDLWLSSQGVAEHARSAVTRRFPAYFVYAVHYELGRSRKNYEPLLEAVDTPAARAADNELEWETYATHLERQTQESVFDEPFSLRQIYIPLRAAYNEETRPKAKQTLTRSTGREKPNRKVIKLADELANWLERDNRNDAIRVISGGPGSGKSVFARIFAADLAAKGYRVLLVPLHLIDPERDISDEVGRFARQEGALGHHPLDPDNPEPDLLLIFDGLDELAGQGKGGFNTAREFVQAVERLLDRRNMQTLAVRVLLSGRELVVQENESLFRRPGQILDLLPYFVPEEERVEYQDPHKLLSHDYRDDWWTTYGSLSGYGYKGLPAQLKVADLAEITQQPLLNYLVALTLTRGKVGFTSELNLNTVYADLVERVYERGYERGRAHVAIRHMKFEDFRRVLEEIALAAWHGDGRTTTVAEIRQHCEASGVGKLLDSFQEGAEKGVTRLLAAFFFRRYGQRAGGDRTFIFTHKSFGEYLTARRIVLAMRKVARDLLRRDLDPDEGYDEKTSLEQWTKVCGPSAITQYLLKFVRREVALESRESLLEWQRAFTRLFIALLRTGMPMERLGVSPFREAQRQSRNAEEALIVALNACALCTAEVSMIEAPTRAAFGTWLRSIQEQRSGTESCVAFDCLSLLDLRNSVLHMQDLYGARLDRSLLQGINAQFASFVSAHLQGADLSRANCIEANFEHAALDAAKLVGCNFMGARLHRTSFRAADLEQASFDGADFGGHWGDNPPRRMKEIFEGANLTRTSFVYARGLPAELEHLTIARDMTKPRKKRRGRKGNSSNRTRGNKRKTKSRNEEK